MAQLEHVNITIPDAQKTARWMEQVFGWHVRWEGPSINGGYSMHVGSKDSYVALYAPQATQTSDISKHVQHGGLNHIAVVVDDLTATQARVEAAGFEAHSHADYEPGERFYFNDQDGIEYEVVAYG